MKILLLLFLVGGVFVTGGHGRPNRSQRMEFRLRSVVYDLCVGCFSSRPDGLYYFIYGENFGFVCSGRNYYPEWITMESCNRDDCGRAWTEDMDEEQPAVGCLNEMEELQIDSEEQRKADFTRLINWFRNGTNLEWLGAEVQQASITTTSAPTEKTATRKSGHYGLPRLTGGF